MSFDDERMDVESSPSPSLLASEELGGAEEKNRTLTIMERTPSVSSLVS